MTGTGTRAGIGVVCAAMFLFSVPALPQTKELSDRSVRVLMDYAWDLTPPKYTSREGKTIVVDKSKREDVMIPLDVAREVIKVGRLSAHAQVCNLKEEQRANFLTMIRRVKAKSKWSDQQLLYISRLHQTTIMMVSGRLMVVEKEGAKVVSEREIKAGRAESCTETERKRVKEQIDSYIDAKAPVASGKAPPPLKTGATPKK
jgi:hypothetical protein